jgi:hypothetical protein
VSFDVNCVFSYEHQCSKRPVRHVVQLIDSERPDCELEGDVDKALAVGDHGKFVVIELAMHHSAGNSQYLLFTRARRRSRWGIHELGVDQAAALVNEQDTPRSANAKGRPTN